MMFRFFSSILLLISSIETCPLKTVDTRSGCYCGIEIDGTNYIHCHPYSIDRIPEFTRSYIHEKLNLTKNSIANLTNTSFHQLKVKGIYLEDNPIQFIDKYTFNPNLLHYLEELHINSITNHNLEFLCVGSWRKLRILKLIGFNFQQFQSCFDKFPRLEKLIIENSQINLITHHIYKLPFLSELSLINNHLVHLQFDDDYLSYSSSSIRLLNLTSNQLRTIPHDLNLRLPHLITLDLSHNLFEKLPLMNQITTLNINLSFNLIQYFQWQDNQHFIDLSSNPICTMEKRTEIAHVILNNLTHLHCDCRLTSFLTSNSTDQWKLFGNQTICATPEMFQGILFKDLTYEQLRKTCSFELPINCQEVTNFEEIQQLSIETEIPIAEKLNDPSNPISSFRLTSFHTLYERNDLLIFWDFDIHSSTNDLSTTQFQIIIEQETSSKTEIIRRTDFLSPYLKQYIIPHLPSNKNYYVCLLITRVSYGTDKYCREIPSSTHQTFRQMIFLNRSIIFGFLVGTILTASILIILAFICHLHSKRKQADPLFNQQQQRYMYLTRNDLDGTYSHSLVSSPSSKYHHLRKNRHRRRTYLTPIPPWYNRNLQQLSSSNPRSPCCFLQYHDRTLSSSTTTNRVISLSSDYSNGIDKEQMTSTSLMSNISLDEQPCQLIRSPTKHVYEELGETHLFL